MSARLRPRDAVAGVALVAAALALLALAGPAPTRADGDDEAGEPPVAIEDVKIGRTRIEHAVDVEGYIKNTGGAALRGISLSFEACERQEDGELLVIRRIGRRWRKGSLAAGARARFRLEEKQMPAFEVYRVKVSAKLGGETKQWTFIADGPGAAPWLEGLARPGSRKPAAGGAAGGGAAADATPRDRVLPLPGGNWTTGADLEVGWLRFLLRKEGSLRITGQVRNGTDLAARSVTVGLSLGPKGGGEPVEVEAKVDQVLFPGEIGDFSVELEKGFEVHSYRYRFGADFVPPASAEEPPAGEGEGESEGEGDGEGETEPPADGGEAAPEAEPETPTRDPKVLELAGGLWVRPDALLASPLPRRGVAQVQPGDILILRFRFLTEDGRPPHAFGELEMWGDFAGGGRHSVKKVVSSALLRVPRGPQKPTRVTHSTVYFDHVQREVAVAVMIAKGPAEPSFSAIVWRDQRDADRWEWKDVEPPYRHEPIRSTR